MYQLKVITNRSSVPGDPADNMKGAEDFLLAVMHAHIVAAAKAAFPAIADKSCHQPIAEVADRIISQFVNLS